MVASIEFQSPVVRSGHILLALMSGDEMERMLTESSEEFKKISVEALSKDTVRILPLVLVKILRLLLELVVILRQVKVCVQKVSVPWTSTQSISLRRARNDEIDPVLGRDFEIRQMVDILIRRRQNNPILTGEAGVW